MEVLSRGERRRRWSLDEKMRIVAEAAAPGSSVSEVARRHDISRQNIYQWRCELKQQAVQSTGKAVFLPVEVTEDEAGPGAGCDVDAPGHPVEIGLRSGRTLRFAADIPDRVLMRLIRVAEAA
ncbi:MAG TPA: transposase [Microvirga sp.]|nr:transposase [Microvirga sp.]